jgi:Na+/H+ antiporter NhaA
MSRHKKPQDPEKGIGTMTNTWTPFLKRAFRFPARVIMNARLLLYFIIVICFLGALGTLIPVAQVYFGSGAVTRTIVYRELATYVIAIAVTAFADCVVRELKEDDPTFKLFLLGLAILATVCAILVLLLDSTRPLGALSLAGSTFAGFVWLMVHDADPTLIQEDAYSALGGENPS